MERNDRNILILGILVLILLAVGYYLLLFSPLRQQYLDAFEERTQREATRQQLEQTVAELENVRRDAPNLERTVLELSKRLPEQDEIPTLVVQLQEIARGARVTQLTIEPGSPEAPPSGGDFSVVPLNMSFEGTYNEMQEFLLRLRNLARLVTVNEVTFAKVGEQEAGGGTTVGGGREDSLTVTITAETYVQPAAAESTSGGGAAPTQGKAGADKVGGGKAKAGASKAKAGSSKTKAGEDKTGKDKTK